MARVACSAFEGASAVDVVDHERAAEALLLHKTWTTARGRERDIGAWAGQSFQAQKKTSQIPAIMFRAGTLLSSS